MIKLFLFTAGVLALCCANLAFAGLEQAEVAFLRGDYDLAIKDCDGSAQGLYLKARILLKENKIVDAQSLFKKILSDVPDSKLIQAAQLGLADTYFADERYEDAIAGYRKLQEKYPQSEFSAISLYKLGKCYLKLGAMEQARFYFQKLQQEYPLSFEAKLIDELDNSEFAHSIQVGCFSGYENAERLVNKLKKKSFDAYISEKEGFPVFYRVRVGRFKTESEAKFCKKSLEKNGYKTRLCP